jgi:hypothetical protein
MTKIVEYIPPYIKLIRILDKSGWRELCPTETCWVFEKNNIICEFNWYSKKFIFFKKYKQYTQVSL